jgi:hypothetical protein
MAVESPLGPQDIRSALLQALLGATAAMDEASREFDDTIIHRIPSGLPHPDGSQRIKNASAKLSVAREQMMKAHHRLNDFIEHGTVPEDLKRSG